MHIRTGGPPEGGWRFLPMSASQGYPRHDLDDILVRYRVFVMARGYPLGEILRQIGGGPPDPSVNVEQGRLQFQTLATPDYRRWQTLQQALINLNRFVFRLAIYDPSSPEESGDPLGILTDADAWRIFLLHHWEFVDEQATAPEVYQRKVVLKNKTKLSDFTQKIRIATDHVKEEWYHDLILPANWQQDTAQLHDAQEYCRAQMSDFVAVWQRIRIMIDLCKRYKAGASISKKYVDEGYPALVNDSPYYQKGLEDARKAASQRPSAESDPAILAALYRPTDYRERWFALMQEGYLVSKPFLRRIKLFGRIPLFWLRWRKYDIRKDIPQDPRILEPFVMRSHNFMTEIATKSRASRNKSRASRKL